MVLTTTQALALGLFIWEEVISVSEIRPVMKQYEKLNCVYMRPAKVSRVRRFCLLTGEISVSELIFVPYEHNFLAWQDTSARFKRQSKENSSPYFYPRKIPLIKDPL